MNDTEAPSITCPPNVTQGNDPGACGAAVAVGTPTTSDNCGVLAGSLAAARSDAQPLGAAFPVGTTTITWTVSDVHGNFASCAQTVTVNDTEAPVIDCTSRVVVGAWDACGSYPLPAPTATDNCGVASVTVKDAAGNVLQPGAPLPPGVHQLTIAATDIHGNTSSCGAGAVKLTILEPLKLVWAPPPIRDDNARDAIENDADVVNEFKSGSVVPHKIQLLDCHGTDVTATKSSSVVVRLYVTERGGPGGAKDLVEVPSGTGLAAAGFGIMELRGNHRQFNLDTSGFRAGTIKTATFFRSHAIALDAGYPDLDLKLGEEDATLESK